MSNLKFIPKETGTIFGTRYAFKIIKSYKGIPGFAPEERETEMGEIVVSFKDKPPYWQFFKEPSTSLEIKDVVEILDKMNKGFIESDFNPLTQ